MMDDLLPSCNRRVISRPISHANSIFPGHFVLCCNCSAEMKWTEKSPLNYHGLGSTIAHWTQRANYPFGSVKVLETAKWKCKQHMLGSVISPEGSLLERVDWIHVYGQIFLKRPECWWFFKNTFSWWIPMVMHARCGHNQNLDGASSRPEWGGRRQTQRRRVSARVQGVEIRGIVCLRSTYNPGCHGKKACASAPRSEEKIKTQIPHPGTTVRCNWFLGFR